MKVLQGGAAGRRFKQRAPAAPTLKRLVWGMGLMAL
ncbi:MAG: hypothetical protein RL748_242, partial [Pseudomonadota bacterium]